MLLLCNSGSAASFPADLFDRWRQGIKIQRGILFDALAAWELRRVPATAQRLDQRGASDEAALADVYGSLGIGERRLIGDDNAGIGDCAGQILVVEDPRGF